MDNGRFGPIEPNKKPKKTYRVDYNRLITAVMVVVILVLALAIYADSRKQQQENENNLMLMQSGTDSVLPAQTPGVRATVSPDELRPTAESEGLLPVFRRANISAKRVAITVDNLSDAENISTLLGLLATYDAKVTFFPTGVELAKNMNVWPQVVIAGHEIENHTYSNQRLSTLMDEDKSYEVSAQTEMLRALIGEEYQPHFLRTENLEDDYDELLHAYLRGNGYYGIARWDENNPESINQVAPGAVLNFPLTDYGLSRLSTAIPVLVNNGYEIVTMNELFLYPENLISSDNTAN